MMMIILWNRIAILNLPFQLHPFMDWNIMLISILVSAVSYSLITLSLKRMKMVVALPKQK